MKAICAVIGLLKIIKEIGGSENIQIAGKIIEDLGTKDKEIVEKRIKLEEIGAVMG